MLTSKSRVDYFNLFSCFLVYVYRSFYTSKYKEDKLYTLDKEAKGLLIKLRHLAKLQLKKATSNNLDLKKGFQTTAKAYNKRLSNFKLNLFLELAKEEGEGEEEEGGYSTSSSSFSSSSSSSFSSAFSSSSSTAFGPRIASSSSSSNSSSPSIASSSKSSSSASSFTSNSTTILAKIQSIRQSNNVLSNTIKEKLSSLFINLFKQQLSLYIFDSPINSFLACYSIKKDLTLKGSLDLSKAYAKFVYCS